MQKQLYQIDIDIEFLDHDMNILKMYQNDITIKIGGRKVNQVTKEII